VLVLVGLAAGGRRGGSSADVALAEAIRDLAGRVQQGDGPMGPEAGDRLETVADHVEAGGGAGDANALLGDAARWASEGRLSGAALTEMGSLLARIDGVDPSLATTTTTTTAPPATPPPAVTDDRDDDEDKDDDEDRRGRKKGRGRG
ncbi:MAG: hypothetical protein ACRD03_11840, partial [Acidimicrobiales bacterium]